MGLFAWNLFLSLAMAAPATGPLFSLKNAEVFKVQDSKGKTPDFHLLGKTQSEQSLAIMVTTLLNTQSNVDPKIPVTPYIDVQVRTLTIEGAKDSNDLTLTLDVSGHDLVMDKKISRTDFLAGKKIDVDYPKTDKNVAGLAISSSGHLTLHLDKKTNNVVFEDVRGHLEFNSPLIGQGAQDLKFKGRGIRQSI